MREIKFRAWDGEGMSLSDDMPALGLSDYNNVPLSYFFGCFKESGCNAIIMQYTGLKDKNGVEIYEGDVLEKIIESETAPELTTLYRYVKWDEENACFSVWEQCISNYFENEWVDSLGYYQIDNELEIISNIYENPDLKQTNSLQSPTPVKEDN